jgi:peroxidase
VPAKALVGLNGIERREGGRITYVHMMFDAHEIVLAEGIASESFQVGEVGLSAMGRGAREELLALFPELATDPAGRRDARPALRAREARAMARLLVPG